MPAGCCALAGLPFRSSESWTARDLSLISYKGYPCFPGGSDGKASAYNAGDSGQSLGREDLWEKEEPGRLYSLGSKRVGHD